MQAVAYALEQYLHPVRKSPGIKVWATGTDVHVRLTERVGVCTDGSLEIIHDGPGTWVHAVIIVCDYDYYLVAHTKWDVRDASNRKMYSMVHYMDIREGWDE